MSSVESVTHVPSCSRSERSRWSDLTDHDGRNAQKNAGRAGEEGPGDCRILDVLGGVVGTHGHRVQPSDNGTRELLRRVNTRTRGGRIPRTGEWARRQLRDRRGCPAHADAVPKKVGARATLHAARGREARGIAIDEMLPERHKCCSPRPPDVTESPSFERAQFDQWASVVGRLMRHASLASAVSSLSCRVGRAPVVGKLVVPTCSTELGAASSAGTVGPAVPTAPIARPTNRERSPAQRAGREPIRLGHCPSRRPHRAETVSVSASGWKLGGRSGPSTTRTARSARGGR